MIRHIEDGRTMWSGAQPQITISAYDYGREEVLFMIDNAELDVRTDNAGAFVIQSRHKTGTDFEHDAARIAYFEGSGLQWKRIAGPHVEFTGVLFKARYYPEDQSFAVGTEMHHDGDLDQIELCDDERCRKQNKGGYHIIMPYMPPKQSMKPLVVGITVRYGGD